MYHRNYINCDISLLSLQHQIIPSTTDMSLTSSTAAADDMERTDEMSRSNSVKDEVAGASSGEDSGVLLHQVSPTHEVVFGIPVLFHIK